MNRSPTLECSEQEYFIVFLTSKGYSPTGKIMEINPRGVLGQILLSNRDVFPEFSSSIPETIILFQCEKLYCLFLFPPVVRLCQNFILFSLLFYCINTQAYVGM